ncbi:MAG: hypothetical protein M1832_000095 [Thelocarpon impressellum]|nr:MAG: hypothetical protein M1832_000095 [Thelocarpon impressellum]
MSQYREWEGEIVPRSFTPGYILLSYVVSYIGALTTLELLHRRTAGRGVYNWFLLIGSSISMGAVAIWSMHFIGNRAIVLGRGQPSLQIIYNSGFTALSFFIPILVVLTAFLAIGSNERVGKCRVVLGGTIAGLAMCGMHYLGQAGIANYTSVYAAVNIAASAVIAIITSITTLTIFFVLRAAWTNSWWKRALCAILLAGTVSGMHWVASVGTQYRFRYAMDAQQHVSRDQTAIIVIALSLSSCALLLILALFAQRRRAKSADRTKQVVLACVAFDKDGRLMVTPEGLLPSQKITNSYIERSFEDVFSISHPVFLWVFRTTRNWFSIRDLLPGMRIHLQATAAVKEDQPNLGASTPGYETAGGIDPAEDYSIIFRELFCVAASSLAEQLNEPLENLGVLYDEIMSTGTTALSKKTRLRQIFDRRRNLAGDLEAGSPAPVVFGRGQLLFIVRRTSKSETTRLLKSGFRFAEVINVVDILARSMQVESRDLVARLHCMQEYSRGDHIMEPGVHLGCFAIRARVGGGFDVVVRKEHKNRLPSQQLTFGGLEDWHLSYLDQIEGWTVGAILNWLADKSRSGMGQEQAFAAHLRGSLAKLAAEIGDPLFHEAVLVSRPLEMPCRGVGEVGMPGRAALIAFRIVMPIHTRAPNPSLVFSPLSVFRCQQHVYKNAPDHDIFARAIHREFAPLVEPRVRAKRAPPAKHIRRSSLVPPHLTPSKGRQDTKSWWGPLSALERRPSGTPPTPDSSSEKDVVDGLSYGGIMVSQEVSVDIREIGDGETEVEMRTFGTSGCATTEVEDPETFVDQLFALSFEGR